MTTAADIMTKKLITVSPTMDLQVLASILEKRKISGCPVIDEEGVVLGVVSKTDLTRARAQGDNLMDVFYRAATGMVGGDAMLDDEYAPWSEGEAIETIQLGELCVADVMNRNVFSVEAGDMVSKVAQQMLEHKVHRFLVTDTGRFVGIVSSTDLLRALAES